MCGAVQPAIERTGRGSTPQEKLIRLNAEAPFSAFSSETRRFVVAMASPRPIPNESVDQ